MDTIRNRIQLKQGSIIKLTYKYSICDAVKQNATTASVKRYKHEMFYVVKDNDIDVLEEKFINVVTNILLNEYICKIQVAGVKWHFLTVENITDKSIITRTAINQCVGNLKGKSKMSQTPYCYHLYVTDSNQPFKHSLRGVPIQIQRSVKTSEDLYRISKIFTTRIPVEQTASQGGLKYVKFRKTKEGGVEYREVISAYAWGFYKHK